MATIPASMKAPVNVGQSTELPPTQSTVPPAHSSPAHLSPPEVPVGVLEVPIGVWGLVCVPGQPEPLKQFSEETCTVIVFPHGAVIRLSAAVVPGQMVLVANRNSHQEVLCRVTNVKKYPNVKGYVEVQFNHSTDGFWGTYDPQGAVKLPDTVAPLAKAEKSAKPHVAAPTPASIPTPGRESISPSIPATSTVRPKTSAAEPSLADDFWSSSFPTEIFARAGEVAPQSTASPMTVPSPVSPNTVRSKPESIKARSVQAPSIKTPARSPAAVAPKPVLKAQSSQAKVPAAILPSTSSSELTQPPRQRFETGEQQSELPKHASIFSPALHLLRSWLKQISTSGTMQGAHFSSRAMVITEIAVVVLFVLGAAGFFFFHRGAAQSAADPTNSALLVASMAANTVQTVPAATNPAPVASQPPIVAATQNQPTKQASDSPAGVGPLQAVSRESAPRKPSWARQIPNARLSFSHAARPAAATTVRAAPPDLTVVPLDIPGDAIHAVLPPGSKILPALTSNPPRTPPAAVGGRLREPQLISRIPTIYPTAAKQIGVEGKVVLSAVIDAMGNVTNVKVISGPVMLQHAAVDAVSKWKYMPTYLDDKPVPAETSITIEFHLR
jgi:TonB family protein